MEICLAGSHSAIEVELTGIFERRYTYMGGGVVFGVSDEGGAHKARAIYGQEACTTVIAGVGGRRPGGPGLWV